MLLLTTFFVIIVSCVRQQELKKEMFGGNGQPVVPAVVAMQPVQPQ